MTKSDWFEIGLKLLGTYFLVVGVVAVWKIMLTLLFASGKGVGDASAGAVALMFPLGEILAGLLLVRLRWGLPDSTRQGTKPLPAYLDEQFEKMEKGGESKPGPG